MTLTEIKKKIFHIPVVCYALFKDEFLSEGEIIQAPVIEPVTITSVDGECILGLNDNLFTPSYSPINICPASLETYLVYGEMPDGKWVILGYEFPGKKSYNPDWVEEYKEKLEEWERRY